jgi:hypothetical protein
LKDIKDFSGFYISLEGKSLFFYERN